MKSNVSTRVPTKVAAFRLAVGSTGFEVEVEGMFGGKAPLRLAPQKSRPHAPSVPMRSAPDYFLCKWGV
jgi:hypothetical protein